MRNETPPSLPSSKWFSIDGTSNKNTPYLLEVVNVVNKALRQNISFDQLLQTALTLKIEALDDGFISFDCCSRDKFNDFYLFEIFEGFQKKIGLRGGSEIERKV